MRRDVEEDGGRGEWDDDDVREAVFVMTCSDVMDYCRKVGPLEGSKTRGSLPKKLVHLCVGVCEGGCVSGCACVHVLVCIVASRKSAHGWSTLKICQGG